MGHRIESGFMMAMPLVVSALLGCSGDEDEDNEELALEHINEQRALHDLPPLISDADLTDAARKHSRDMVERNVFSHKGSDGSNAGDRIAREGYAWSTWAENIECGSDTAEKAVRGWMASSGHRENILSDTINVGVGYAYEESSNCGNYWTAVFASKL